MVPLQDFLEAPEHLLNNDHEFTSFVLLTKALHMDPERIDNNRSAATRIGNLMQRLGWSKRRQPTGRRDWVYVRPPKDEKEQEPTRPAQAAPPAVVPPSLPPGFDPVGF